LRKPFWTKEELAAQAEQEEKDQARFGRGCGCLAEALSILFISFCVLPFLWFAS
jgi:hypothetical protein